MKSNFKEAWHTSYYNFAIPLKTKGALLYNSAKGSLIKLESEQGLELAQSIAKWPLKILQGTLDKELIEKLLQFGFIRREGSNSELLEIRERYWKARGVTPMVITITTTQDCNLGCFYCFENRTKDRLEPLDINSIIILARETLTQNKKSSLHVDWYGGEPLLNIAFMEECSSKLQQLCNELKISYHSSIISNGTLWPDNPEEFVVKHRIRQVQISFDGVGETHSKIRRLRKGYSINNLKTSFGAAYELVGKLLEVTQVDVRFNISRQNVSEVDRFIELVQEADWLNRRYPCIILPARVSMYSEKSSFVREIEFSQDEFEKILQKFSHLSRNPNTVKSTWFEDGISPKNSVCAALANSSIVVGAEGLLYQCGLQVGEKNRAVGQLQKETLVPRLNQNLEFGDAGYWDNFDPTLLPNCSKCTFLPICWGGCPKKHLEGDTHSLNETSLYYRKNLPSLIAQKANATISENYTLSDKQQFKS